MKSTVNSTINKKLTIAIMDDDNFYMEGLIVALSAYFKNKNRKVNFILGHWMKEPADITFQAIRCGTCIAPHSQYHTNCGKSHYFAIVDNRDFHLQHLYRHVEKNNVFYRHQPVSTLLQLIEKNIFSPQKIPETYQSEQEIFPREPLTLREHEVLCHLVQGKTHACAANCLGIKVKTISSHKRAAMKKLNFRRTNELFHWMLQGGLSRHQPIKGH